MDLGQTHILYLGDDPLIGSRKKVDVGTAELLLSIFEWVEAEALGPGVAGEPLSSPRGCDEGGGGVGGPSLPWSCV